MNINLRPKMSKTKEKGAGRTQTKRRAGVSYSFRSITIECVGHYLEL